MSAGRVMKPWKRFSACKKGDLGKYTSSKDSCERHWVRANRRSVTRTKNRGVSGCICAIVAAVDVFNTYTTSTAIPDIDGEPRYHPWHFTVFISKDSRRLLNSNNISLYRSQIVDGCVGFRNQPRQPLLPHNHVTVHDPQCRQSSLSSLTFSST